MYKVYLIGNINKSFFFYTLAILFYYYFESKKNFLKKLYKQNKCKILAEAKTIARYNLIKNNKRSEIYI